METNEGLTPLREHIRLYVMRDEQCIDEVGSLPVAELELRARQVINSVRNSGTPAKVMVDYLTPDGALVGTRLVAQFPPERRQLITIVCQLPHPRRKAILARLEVNGAPVRHARSAYPSQSLRGDRQDKYDIFHVPPGVPDEQTDTSMSLLAARLGGSASPIEDSDALAWIRLRRSRYEFTCKLCRSRDVFRAEQLLPQIRIRMAEGRPELDISELRAMMDSASRTR